MRHIKKCREIVQKIRHKILDSVYLSKSWVVTWPLSTYKHSETKLQNGYSYKTWNLRENQSEHSYVMSNLFSPVLNHTNFIFKSSRQNY